jgi:hypothetical protein
VGSLHTFPLERSTHSMLPPLRYSTASPP